MLGGVALVPWRVPKAEAALVGKTINNDVLMNVAKVALEGAEPLAKNAYKVPLTETLVRRALARVGGLAENPTDQTVWPTPPSFLTACAVSPSQM